MRLDGVGEECLEMGLLLGPRESWRRGLNRWTGTGWVEVFGDDVQVGSLGPVGSDVPSSAPSLASWMVSKGPERRRVTEGRVRTSTEETEGFSDLRFTGGRPLKTV